MKGAGEDGGESRAVAAILRVGIALTAALVGSGIVLLLLRGTVPPNATAGNLIGLAARAAEGAVRLDPAALVELGLIALLLTPVLRVAAGVAASARARDGLYTVIGLVVLALLLFGLLGGHALE